MKVELHHLLASTPFLSANDRVNAAVDEVRRAEFFRQGGRMRGSVKEKRWLLLTRWVNLTAGKRRQLNELFALNRRLLKAYLLKESLDWLWNYRYAGAVVRYFIGLDGSTAAATIDPFRKLVDLLLEPSAWPQPERLSQPEESRMNGETPSDYWAGPNIKR